MLSERKSWQKPAFELLARDDVRAYKTKIAVREGTGHTTADSSHIFFYSAGNINKITITHHHNNISNISSLIS